MLKRVLVLSLKNTIKNPPPPTCFPLQSLNKCKLLRKVLWNGHGCLLFSNLKVLLLCLHKDTVMWFPKPRLLTGREKCDNFQNWYLPQSSFFRGFIKFRKSNINFIMSVMSVRLSSWNQLGFNWIDFQEIWLLRVLQKFL